MNILIDGYNLGLEHGTGVATYGRNLSESIAGLGHEVSLLYGLDRPANRDPMLKEVLFFDAAKRKKKNLGTELIQDCRNLIFGYRPVVPEEVGLNGAVVTTGMRGRVPTHDHLWNASNIFGTSRTYFRAYNKFSSIDVGGKVDIAHLTYPLPIKIRGAKNVYTLHDLVPLRLPFTTLDDKKYYAKLCRAIARDADHIVTVSEASRRDIIELLGVDPDRVTNTYQCAKISDIDLMRTLDDVRNELFGIFGLNYQDYFLFFGAIEPKKNVGRMIEAYLGSGVKTPLVMVGAPGWSSESELRLLKSLSSLDRENRSSRILKLEYLPSRILLSLIRGAKATLFPSLYEGFGLPALESMQLGTPVLTSNTSSMPEIVGEAAIQVDPYDVAAIARGIRELDANDGLRARLSTAGIEQATQFSEQKYKARLSALYDKLIKK